jgi:DUF1365 family protein
VTAKQPKTAKTAKPAAKTTRPRTTRRRRKPSHHEISQRAYFIHLDEGGADELGNWLRAERELMAA